MPKLERCFIKSWSTSGDAGAPVNGPLFLADPVGTLRGHGVAVLPAEEHAWRQLASALQALQRAADPRPGPQRAHAPASRLAIELRFG